MGKKPDKRVFSAAEKKKMRIWYETRGADPKGPQRYKDSPQGKAAYKRAAKGKTSTKKGY